MKTRAWVLFLALLFAGIAVSRASEPPALRAIATADVTEVHPDDVFEVTLSLQNLTGVTQKIRIPDFGWDRFWKSSNSRVAWDYVDSAGSNPITIAIPPHETYEFPIPLKMFVSEGYKDTRVTFKMGFKLGGFDKFAWSAPLTLDVTP
jgi:hypothetical protein